MPEKRKFMPVGGQAIIEGITMKGPQKTCFAVRKPDGTLFTEVFDTKPNSCAKIPFLRGAVAMIESLISGYKYINRSADIAFEDESEPDSKLDKWVSEKFGEKAMAALSAVAAIVGILIAVVLFAVLPTFLTGLLADLISFSRGLASVESLIKIIIFIGYLFLVTRMKEVHRVFEYHGAEHKSINCIEHGDALTVDNVRRHSRFHPRCGTSFLFIVVIVSIIIFSLVPWSGVLSRALLKVLLVPLVIGISYEIIQFAGKHDNIVSRILSAPGLAIQRLTTFEPDDSEIEVAIEALMQVLPKEESDN